MLSSLGLTRSFGFGDRLGLATSGHIAAVKGSGLAPVFAQQSVRENARTGRSPQQVMDDAQRAVDEMEWDAPWGADADHLKTVDDLLPFSQAGYTFFTVDPGAYVDNKADTDSLATLKEKSPEFKFGSAFRTLSSLDRGSNLGGVRPEASAPGAGQIWPGDSTYDGDVSPLNSVKRQL